MKRTVKLIFTVSLLLLCMMLLVSCGEKLDKPSGLVFDEETLTIRWNKVANAKSYTIEIPGEDRQKTTKANFISLEYLDSGLYDIKIRANGNGDEFRDSNWAVYEDFERPVENGLKFALINNDTEYEVVGGGTAEGAIVIPATYRNKKVTSIADKAFYNNSKITSVTVGDNIKSIGDKAFTKSSKLESVIIPEGVEYIGPYAFQSCKVLTSLKLPSTLEEINPFTFSRCDLLKTVDFGSSIKTIGEYAFSSCIALEKIILPDTIEYIGEYAFSDCTVATELKLGANLTEIDSFAFYNCEAIGALNFGEKLKYIRSDAFGNCKTFKEITIPNSVETIEYGVFSGCSSVDKIKLGTGLTKIGSQVFKDTKVYDAAESLFCLDGWLIEAKDKEIEQLELPAGTYAFADFALQNCKKLTSLELSGIVYVGRASFYNCKELWQIIFDNALISIGENAFRDCEKLMNVTLCENLVTIGNYAFMNCSRLYEFDIPSSVTTIGSYAFNGTAKHTTTKSGPIYMDDWVVGMAAPSILTGYYDVVNIEEGIRGIANYSFYGIPVFYTYMPDSVEIIGKGAFYGNAFPFPAPISIRLSQNIKYIGDYAFYGCSNWIFGEGEGEDMTKLVIPNGTEYIGRSAFYKCSYITTLEIPGTVKTIGNYAFYGCQNLGHSQLTLEGKEEPIIGSLTLGDGIQYIGAQAFRNCVGLTDIVIPNSVTYIGEKTFFGCQKLKNVTLGSGLTKINDYTFYKCIALESISLTDNIKSIGAFAFRGNSALTEVNLNRVEVINHHAFLGCTALKSINIPATVREIKDYAFRGCFAMTSIIIPEEVTDISKHAFYALTSATIYAEVDEMPKSWSGRFNSSFRPIIFGVTLSDDNSYVVSFKKDSKNPLFANELNALSSPSREGYKFIGFCDVAVNDSYADGEWQAPQNATVYEASEIDTVPDGTLLYAIWVEEIPEE